MQKLAKFEAVVVLCSLIIGTLTACGTSTATPVPQTSSATAVSPATPVASSGVSGPGFVNVTGQIEPVNWAELSFLGSGTVDAVLVTPGQAVAAGQPLVRLRTTNLELSLKATQAALTSAQAQLAQMTAPPRPEQIAAQEADLAAAQGGIDQAVANRDLQATLSAADVAVAQAAVAVAQAEATAAQDEYDRFIATGNLGPAEEQSRVRLYAAQAALAAAEATLAEVQAGPSAAERRSAAAIIAQATALRDESQAQLDLLLAGPMTQTVAVAEAGVAQAEVTVAQAQAALDAAILTAPYTGTIVSVSVRPYQNQSILASTPVLVLADLTQFQVRAADLDELYVASVKPGQSATITFDALPGRQFAGRVTTVGLRGNPGTTTGGGSIYTVVITLDEVDPQMLWGMTANVTIATGP